MSASKILVGDDEPDVAETVELCSKQEGYKALGAANGLGALGAARSQDPDLIGPDGVMPGEIGYREAPMIRQDEAVRNFMDYSDDSCMNQFTPRQGIRMQDIVATFRSSL